jgi:hypothetical protein
MKVTAAQCVVSDVLAAKTVVNHIVTAHLQDGV